MKERSDHCPVFDPAAANKLLDDKGWVRGFDSVRTKGNERLEFEYSVAAAGSYYESLKQGVSGFTAELPVDRDGLVADYPGLFRRVGTW